MQTLAPPLPITAADKPKNRAVATLITGTHGYIAKNVRDLKTLETREIFWTALEGLAQRNRAACSAAPATTAPKSTPAKSGIKTRTAGKL